MTALYIILGIILFFVLLLSIRVKISVHSEGGIDLAVSWLFLKFKILPNEHKKKKKKEKKPKKPKKEKPKDETVPEPKEKKENVFVKFYHNNGVSGVVELVQKLAEALGGMFKGIGRAFIFEEIYISLIVGSGGSADTAEKYGKTCAAVFPAMGLITDTMRVKKYSVDVIPDFISGRNEARLHAKIDVIPRKLINAVVAFGFRVLFKVGIRFLKGLKGSKPKTAEEKINTKSITKGEAK